MHAHTKMRLLVPMFLLLLLWSAAGRAEPLDAQFLARQSCPASVSIRRPGNPGKVMLEPGRTYRVIAQNKTPPANRSQG